VTNAAVRRGKVQAVPGLAYNVTVGQTENTGAAGAYTQDWQKIGWQGITLDLPPDWSLAGFGGDARSGTLRCDALDSESTTLPLGLECRWIGARKKPSDEQLRSRADSLIAVVAKSAKRAGIDIDSSVYEWEGERFEGSVTAYRFAWRTDRAASGSIWYCEVCRRVVIAQVYGLGGRSFVRQADAIRYELVSSKVMNIYLQLQFRRGRSNDMLTVEQWSLANVQLKGAYLDEWFERKRDEMVRGFDIDGAEREVSGHSALWLTGSKEGLAGVADTVRSAFRLKRAARCFTGVLWECPEQNKACLIQSIARRPEPALVEEMAARLICHKGGWFLSNTAISDSEAE
jgi:hypothetical protein